MLELEVFKSEQFGSVRIQTDKGNQQVYFLANDVGKALGYNRPTDAVRRYCKGVVILKTPTMGGPQNMKFIKMGDVFHLVMRSKLKDAIRFQDWVCNEVLPQIQRTGGYINLNDNPAPDEILKRALEVANRTIQEKDAILQNQQKDVEFVRAVTASSDCIEIHQLAKFISQNGYEIGQNRLLKWLRQKNYIFQNSTAPMQQYVRRGYFKQSEHLEKESIRVKTMVTAKGQRYFLAKFLTELQNSTI